MTATATTETAALPTPAADHLARTETYALAAIERIRLIETERLVALSKAEVLKEAVDKGLPRITGSSTKANMIFALAEKHAAESGVAVSLREDRAAAEREGRVIVAILRAPHDVEKAREAVVKAATEESGWGPETVADRAVEWEKARAALRQWKAVESVAVEEQISPVEAMEKVAAYAASDLVSTCASGSGRSTSETRNLMRDADIKGTADFLRKAARYSQAVSRLIRY